MQSVRGSSFTRHEIQFRLYEQDENNIIQTDVFSSPLQPVPVGQFNYLFNNSNSNQNMALVRGPSRAMQHLNKKKKKKRNSYFKSEEANLLFIR